MQMENGLYFVFEHPRSASSWKLPEMERFVAEYGGVDNLVAGGRVLEAVADQCAFGLTAKDDDGQVRPVLKPTRFLTNSVAIQRELSVRCRGCAKHALLEGSRTAPAAKYPRALCRAVCRGLVEQVKMDSEDVMCLACVDEDCADPLDTIEHEANDWETATKK